MTQPTVQVLLRCFEELKTAWLSLDQDTKMLHLLLFQLQRLCRHIRSCDPVPCKATIYDELVSAATQDLPLQLVGADDMIS